MDNQKNTPSKKRAANYTQAEIKLLVKLCLKYSSILENKQTDAVMWKKKEETWKLLDEEFNGISGTVPRSVDSLKQKYEGIKKELKRKVRKNKEETMKTGGGVPNNIPIEDFEKPILEIISMQVHGLPGRNDCDGELPKTDLTGMINMQEETGTVPSTSSDNDKEYLERDIELCDDFNERNPAEGECITIEVFGGSNEPTQPGNNEHTSNWGSWNPKMLKRKKSAPLCSKTKRFKKAEVHERVDQLIHNRQDLVGLQRALIEEEKSFKKLEHEEKMKKIQEEIKSIRKMDLRAETEQLKRLELLELEILLKKKQLMD